MPELFSDDWMVDYGNAWNDESDLGDALAKIGFSSNIGYGFDGEDQPRGYLQVENGYVTGAGAYSGQPLNWDLRAKPADWKKWCDGGLGMMAMGMAYTTGKLKFKTGDYGAMVKNPAMAGPFIKSFSVMGRVATS
ncbi:hypothetical protein [Rhodobacter ferrooxidans]|uniref:SCP-2 sterol transfer family protein n=1 Tax=Rhodobacter ferrooxidans TaxID=371731 RepID=C8S1C3_9RHOB|nr:hypothetical protein [Rhodobacter sp. SW2]EEW25321.1 conserved hypothetical protein [Rhodobacter sp. SW2]